MTGNKFDGQTTWEPTDGFRFTWNGGWEVPGQDFVIDKKDIYWTTNLANAQEAYGDPNIQYNTDDNDAERYLVFGDGTRVPADGTLVYRDSANNLNWINNGDGTFTEADENFQPVGQPFPPAGYRRMADGKYAPIDARGNQVGALHPQPANFPASPGWHETAEGVATPLNANGDYYEINPATGQHKYFDKNGNPISEEKYRAGTPFPQQRSPADRHPGPTASGAKPPLQSTQVSVPDGMSAPQYPEWATDVDPDIPNQLTGVIVRLYELFGSGTPATSELPEFPFSTDTGESSGIDAYDDLKPDFKRIESEFDAAARAFKTAVQNSANVTKAGRDAINNAISTFNSTSQALDEGDWDGLLRAESTLLDTVKTAVENASNSQQDVPSNPAGGPPNPMGAGPESTSGIPPVSGDPSLDTNRGLEDLLNGALGAPFGSGMPMGGNPLGGLGGMNPLGGLGGGGNPMGGGGNPLSPLSSAVKPLAKLAEAEPGNADDKKSPITPLNAGPQTAPPPAASPGATPAQPPAAAAETGSGAAGPPTVAPAGNASGVNPTVTLPDGKQVEAPNEQAAKAAQNAIDNASPGGDAAQKAYSPTGLNLPGDGKNLGARIDPSDMQPGDVLKWQDKTMVAVAPGLVADPSEPGKVHTLEEVFKDQKGFEGVFRPTETDPTLSTHPSAPPLADPQASPHQGGQPPTDRSSPPQPGDDPRQESAPSSPGDEPELDTPLPDAVSPEPPPDSVPLSGPGPAPAAPPPAPAPSSTVPQEAPPSPFEGDAPPPATRTTKHERIAAGLE